ncbi:transglycosylase domain-containing protein [Actinomadura macrotermitis]|uniref:Monofunctional biosynthetic peptidoglycan transglycosylase n=1 Tax=Actinomadura macrotermitis TaxID=2585200 RepID=A0A7K0C128_9ACTN|nr:transglycosylase domain-containing protein [Actinomadura macrotermitis]MQY06504.1 Monofunctional biosynthetic peptidoglycan transglycosylase [Actinomadura macrotermitis]
MLASVKASAAGGTVVDGEPTAKGDGKAAASEVSGKGDADGKTAVAAQGETATTSALPAADGTTTEKPPADAKGGKGGGGKPPKKVRSRRARYGRRILFSLLAFIGFVVAAFGVAYFFTPVPTPQEAAIAQGPTFYYSDGKTQIAKTGVNREAVRLSDIPPGVRNAVIAAENRSFYQDPGVSVKGTARAFWTTATGEQLQGGSTITQQMVRNYYGGIGKERSVTRKLKEIMVSLKIGREKSKDWILEQYLNTIYFGRDAYGVQAAAKAYYGKDVKQLTPAEGAYLAAAIQQPSNFSEPEGAKRAYAEQRWHAVVGNMVRDNAVTQADANAMTFPTPVRLKITNILKGQKGYMVNVAKKELVERRGFSEDEINRSGLKITTTFDKRLMDALKEAVNSNVPKGTKQQIRTAAVSVDPGTGQVVAFYGGRNYLDEALSSAFGDWAQAGSGFKPIALAAALDDGKSLGTSYDGSSPQYFGRFPVHNDSNENFGSVDLVTMTEHSINTAYVNLAQDIGNDKIAKMAEKMGIPADQMTAAQRASAVFPLGVISVHPVQQAGVYATFAANGKFRQPYVVKSVSGSKGESTRTFSEKGKQAFSAQTAHDATYAMERVVRGGTGRGAQLPDGRDVAGKTGTTNEGRAIWFNGFIPQMATTVAMFRSDNKPLNIPGYGSYGGQLPAQIWSSYMSEAVNIKGYSAESFPEPSSYGGGYDDGPPSNGGPTGPSRTSGPEPTRTPSRTRTPRPGDGENTKRPTPPTHRPTLPTLPPIPTPGGGDAGLGPDRRH